FWPLLTRPVTGHVVSSTGPERTSREQHIRSHRPTEVPDTELLLAHARADEPGQDEATDHENGLTRPVGEHAPDKPNPQLGRGPGGNVRHRQRSLEVQATTQHANLHSHTER